MPSTSQDVIDACTNILEGESIDDHKAIEYLKAKGFELSRHWTWLSSREPNDDESMMIRYLIEEWDFGGWEYRYG